MHSKNEPQPNDSIILPDIKKTDLSTVEKANALSANLIVEFTIIAVSFPGGNRTNVSPLIVNTDPYSLLRLRFDSSTENSKRFVQPRNIELGKKSEMSRKYEFFKKIEKMKN